jgi:hypothetical protein
MIMIVTCIPISTGKSTLRPSSAPRRAKYVPQFKLARTKLERTERSKQETGVGIILTD